MRLVPQIRWDRTNKVWNKITLRGNDRNSAMKIKEWCENSLGGQWMFHPMSYAPYLGSKSGMVVFRFEHSDDAFAFRMRWWVANGYTAPV